MKIKEIGCLALVCVFLFLTGCSAQEKIVVQPTSLEELHYQIDVDSVPKSVREDSFFGNQEDFEIPNLVGTYTVVGAYWHHYLGSDLYDAAILRAVPANTTHIKDMGTEFPIADWEGYRIFQNKDIIVFDLSPMLNPEETLPERIRKQEEESYYQLQKEYQEGKIPEERYINTPLQSIMVQTRYLDYLWEYYQEHLSELIVKAE